MSFRPQPRHHLAGTALWTAVAAAGLWPFWPGLIEVDGKALTFVDLIRYSDGWLAFVGIAGLIGILVGLLHGSKALDLWLDLRALKRGRMPGEGRALRLGLASATSLASLLSIGWTVYHDLRTDAYGNPRALVEQQEAQATRAWVDMKAAFQADRPDAQLVVKPGADPAPVLQAIARSAVVSEAFHVSPTGVFTVLNHGVSYVRDLRTWRPLPTRPLWDPPLPYGHQGPRLRFAGDPTWLCWLAEDLSWSTEGFTPSWTFATRGDFEPTWRERRTPLYLRGNARTGWTGYVLSEDWVREQGRAILRQHGVEGDWVTEVVHDAYIVPPPAGAGRWDMQPLSLVLDSNSYDTAFTDFLQNAVFSLAALFVLFVAANIEAVRQFRLLIAERAMTMAQSSFVSGVSHEMRTPLATMKLYGELLEQKLDQQPGQREEFVGAILTEVDRLHRLVENVLDFARISGKKRTYAFVPTALHGALEEAIASAKGPLQAAGMAVELHCPAPLTASVDRDALVQAVANLVTNAAKYAADGGRVWVTAVPREGGVTIEVQDFGAGIPREEQARIFQPFYRVAGTAAGGTGLGLALVREYVVAHGGWLELESPPGRGATFRLHLPEDPARPLLARPAAMVAA